jgi:hypothetical protein
MVGALEFITTENSYQIWHVVVVVVVVILFIVSNQNYKLIKNLLFLKWNAREI